MDSFIVIHLSLYSVIVRCLLSWLNVSSWFISFSRDSLHFRVIYFIFAWFTSFCLLLVGIWVWLNSDFILRSLTIHSSHFNITMIILVAFGPRFRSGSIYLCPFLDGGVIFDLCGACLLICVALKKDLLPFLTSRVERAVCPSRDRCFSLKYLSEPLQVESCVWER